MAGERRGGRRKAQTGGAAGAAHVRDEEHEYRQAERGNVQPHEGPVCAREETGRVGVSRGRCTCQREEVEARTRDVSRRRERLDCDLVDFCTGLGQRVRNVAVVTVVRTARE